VFRTSRVTHAESSLRIVDPQLSTVSLTPPQGRLFPHNSDILEKQGRTDGPLFASLSQRSDGRTDGPPCSTHPNHRGNIGKDPPRIQSF